MRSDKTLIPVLGDQLSLDLSSLRGADPANSVVLMMEVDEETTYVRHHRRKIAYILSAMRHHAQALRAAGWTVDYVRLDDPDNSGSFTGEVARALARHAPARFTWGQAATLAGLKPAGGHYNAWRKQLRDRGLVEEVVGFVSATTAGMTVAGAVPPAPSTPEERLALWCARLPSPAPEMLRALAAAGERYTDTAELAAALAKKPTGGHWNSGIATLRNNGLIEVSGKRLRVGELFR